MFRKKKKQCKEESLHGCECPRRGMKKKLFHDKCGCPKLICVGKNINCKSYIYSFIPSLIHLFIRSFIYSKSASHNLAILVEHAFFSFSFSLLSRSSIRMSWKSKGETDLQIDKKTDKETDLQIDKKTDKESLILID